MKELNPVAILFSGGLDSMILAALLNECLDSRCKYFYNGLWCFPYIFCPDLIWIDFLTDGIDLLNVSFDGELAPDRVSAKAGIKELTGIAPSRKYMMNFFSFTQFVISS